MERTSIITSDGIRLDLTDHGGDGAAVMLIAGFTAAATSWVFQVEALVEADYRVLCLDRRSHGTSEAPPFGQRMARHGKDLHDVLAGLDLDDVALIGGSMGASTIWAYVDQFGNGRVRGVLSIDQTPKMLNADGWAYGFYGYTPEMAGTLFADGVPMTGRGFTVEQAKPGMIRLLDRLGEGGALRPGLKPETLPLLRDHAMQDWRDVIDRVSVPVLMVAGRDSQFWPCEHAEAAVAVNPDGRAVVIDDCGHVANLDQVEVFNAHMLEFLGEL
ncbi:MAG TPA: alpha/beta hydrolase [Micromonosporaceae bacterium]